MSTTARARNTPKISVKRPDVGRAAERIGLRDAARRLAEGELGSLRVLIMLAAIWTIFTIADDRFLTAVNLTNLTLQIAACELEGRQASRPRVPQVVAQVTGGGEEDEAGTRRVAAEHPPVEAEMHLDAVAGDGQREPRRKRDHGHPAA